jgi:enolase
VRISHLSGLEILDSRGQPTLRATCTLASGATGSASVPSGASTGSNEARELRDEDPARYGGRGCRKAAAIIGGELDTALRGLDLTRQEELDRALLDIDGTPDKSRIGANTTLATSLAFARAAAAERGEPLYTYFARLVDHEPRTIPRPEINLFSGGRHAGNQIALQDVLVVPTEATTLDDALTTTSDVYRRAVHVVSSTYGMRELKADEGGLAPSFPTIDAALADASEAIADAPVRLSIDVAATQVRRGDAYVVDGADVTSDEMIERLLTWVRRYDIIAVEDGLGEDDWDGWVALRKAAGGTVRLVGDDLLCTRTDRIERAIACDAADALLLKVNQVGTLTESSEAHTLAREAGWLVVASARSGETEDSWLADLAVGWGADLIKIGSIRQSDRLAKYNRLLEIAHDTGFRLADGV